MKRSFIIPSIILVVLLTCFFSKSDDFYKKIDDLYSPSDNPEIPGGFAVAIIKEGRATASPNAGLTMAAMAGGLGVALEKAGHYRLGVGLGTPVTADIWESVKVMWWVAAMICCLSLIVLAVHHAIL